MQRLTMSCLFLKKIFNILNYLQSRHNFNQIVISYYTRIVISIMEYIWSHSLQTTIHVFVICNNSLTLTYKKLFCAYTLYRVRPLTSLCVPCTEFTCLQLTRSMKEGARSMRQESCHAKEQFHIHINTSLITHTLHECDVALF